MMVTVQILKKKTKSQTWQASKGELNQTRGPRQHISATMNAEVIMVLSQHRQLWAGQKVKNTEIALQVGAEESAQEPPGFERGRVNQKNLKEKQVMLEIEGPQTKGSKHASLDSSGCEANDQARAVRRPKQNKRKGSLNGDQGPTAARGNTSNQNLNDTISLDSCEKLAHKALQIGKALGIKVVRNERAAIATLKESMAKKKSGKTIQNNKN